MSTQPKRIQRERTKGWKAPPGAVYVGRPSKYGNPYKPTATRSLAESIGWFRTAIRQQLLIDRDFLEPLRGKDLMCWCALDSPCHADVLLELANLSRRREEQP